jgi:hypothetical protein
MLVHNSEHPTAGEQTLLWDVCQCKLKERVDLHQAEDTNGRHVLTGLNGQKSHKRDLRHHYHSMFELDYQ